jgi:hypothetical protein
VDMQELAELDDEQVNIIHFTVEKEAVYGTYNCFFLIFNIVSYKTVRSSNGLFKL